MDLCHDWPCRYNGSMVRSSRVTWILLYPGAFFVPFVLLLAAFPGAKPQMDIEPRIDALLARMTLEEKLGQMSQTTFPRGLPTTARDEIRRGRWGSFFNGGTIQEKAEAQRIATKESRLG